MTLADYIKALGQLPMSYGRLPAEDVRQAFFMGTIIICHPSQPPLYYNKETAGWHEVRLDWKTP